MILNGNRIGDRPTNLFGVKVMFVKDGDSNVLKQPDRKQIV
jgi:hypothetical protein